MIYTSLVRRIYHIGLIGNVGCANDVGGTLIHQRDGESDKEEEATKYDIR